MSEEAENDLSKKTEPETKDVENNAKKIKYPRSIPFIIVNEFCERFNYYGMRTILVLYLTRVLLYSEDTSTMLYHAFSTLVYFICIFGGILADSWLGKFRTILYLSIVYVIGSVTIASGALPALSSSAAVLTLIGLLLIAIGSGGIKPCVSAFGGDQFKLPDQARQLAVFFSIFYFSINLGSFISTSVTPILRDVRCLGEDSCFSLAFGVPAGLMVVSILIFVAGKSMYVDTGLKGNMIVQVSKCIKTAISVRSKEKKTAPKEHWLDYAESTYGKRLVNETKILMNVLVLYIPLPIFWTLFDQQGSRWTFQATRMDGDIGFYEIKPDQMQVVNPFLILAFIPLYEAVFYPLLSKIGIRRPLQKIVLGGVMAGLAFVCSGLVEIQLEQTYPVIPSAGNAQLRIFNGMSCNYQATTNVPDYPSFTIASMSRFEERFVKVDGQSTFTYNMVATPTNAACPPVSGTFILFSETATSYFLNGDASGADMQMYEDDPQKSAIGFPMYRMLINNPGTVQPITMLDIDNDLIRFENNTNFIGLVETFPANYQVRIGNNVVGDIQLRLGGVYTIIIRQTGPTTYVMNEIEISQANSVNMLWLLPQYIIMTLGEVMYSVTGLQFSFDEAPISMKSVLQGFWMLTIAFGNLLVIIISGAKIFDSQTGEFFLFAGLMFVDMAIFAYLAYRYKALNINIEDDEVATAPIEEDDKATPYVSDKQL